MKGIDPDDLIEQVRVTAVRLHEARDAVGDSPNLDEKLREAMAALDELQTRLMMLEFEDAQMADAKRRVNELVVENQRLQNEITQLRLGNARLRSDRDTTDR